MTGIFPREPRNKKKLNKGSTAPTAFYYAKDIAFLAHEPVLQKLREHKSFAKKLARALGRGEWSVAKSLEQSKPVYRLDHIVKERCAGNVISIGHAPFMREILNSVFIDTLPLSMLSEISMMPCVL